MILFLLLVCIFGVQDTTEIEIKYFPALLEAPKYEISPFRGEPYLFEVTKPYLNFDEGLLSFLEIANQGVIPYPHDLQYVASLQDVYLEELDDTETPLHAPYIFQNLFITFEPSPVFRAASTPFPSHLVIRQFDREVPFSQIRLFRDKDENEKMQFTFGRDITRYGKLNVSADYHERFARSKRSLGFDGSVSLPFGFSSRFTAYTAKDEIPTMPREQKLLFASLSRKEGMVGVYRTGIGMDETTGFIANGYLYLPFQALTAGFDLPSIDSTYYRVHLVDRINPVPLLYIVPRLTIDANKDYLASLGIGYHLGIDAFAYTNVSFDTSKTAFGSLGFRIRKKNGYFESFVFGSSEDLRDYGGIALMAHGELSPNFNLTCLLLTRLTGTSFIYLQPVVKKSFKKGKLTPALFVGVQYPRTGDIEGSYGDLEDGAYNAGFMVEIIDVSLYFTFNDVTDPGLRTYKFGVRWDFFD
jgi:hypothetical protein